MGCFQRSIDRVSRTFVVIFAPKVGGNTSLPISCKTVFAQSTLSGSSDGAEILRAQIVNRIFDSKAWGWSYGGGNAAMG